MEPQTLAFPFPVSFQTLLYQSKAVRTSQTRRRSPPAAAGNDKVSKRREGEENILSKICAFCG